MATSPSLACKGWLVMEKIAKNSVSPRSVDRAWCPLLRVALTAKLFTTYSNCLGSLKAHCMATMGSMLFVVREMVTMLSAMPLAVPTCSSFTENGFAMIVATCSPLMALDLTTNSALTAPRSVGVYSIATDVVCPASMVSVVCLGTNRGSVVVIFSIVRGKFPTFLSCRFLV